MADKTTRLIGYFEEGIVYLDGRTRDNNCKDMISHQEPPQGRVAGNVFSGIAVNDYLEMARDYYWEGLENRTNITT